MITTLLFLSSPLSPIPTEETLALGLRAGDKLVYAVEMKSSMLGLDAKGKLSITVDKKEGDKLTLSWPQVDFTSAKGATKPIEAGSAVLTDKGIIVKPDAKGQAVLFLLAWALPDKAVSVGETFPVKSPPEPMAMELKGKLDKMDKDGTLAVFLVDGKMKAGGGELTLRWNSYFDVKRALFREAIVSMLTPQGQTMSSFSFKLAE